MMKGNTALRVAITGANGNIGRKLIAALLAAPDIAAIHAIDRDVAGLSPHGGAWSQFRLIFEGQDSRTHLRALTRSSIWRRRI
jgi:nucleoside-diphosphate-sugar epimerase